MTLTRSTAAPQSQLDRLDGEFRKVADLFRDVGQSNIDVLDAIAYHTQEVMMAMAVWIEAHRAETEIQNMNLAHLNKLAQHLVDGFQRNSRHFGAQLRKNDVRAGMLLALVKDMKYPLTLGSHLFTVRPEGVDQLSWTSQLKFAPLFNNHLLMLIIVVLVGASCHRIRTSTLP